MVAECGFEGSDHLNQLVQWGGAECGFGGSDRLNQLVQRCGAVLVARGRWFGERFRPWLPCVALRAATTSTSKCSGVELSWLLWDGGLRWSLRRGGKGY